MAVKFRNTICPLQLSLHWRAALSSNSNGTRSVYSRKNPKSNLQYIVRCLRFQRRKWEVNSNIIFKKYFKKLGTKPGVLKIKKKVVIKKSQKVPTVGIGWITVS
jgi:hypothetical protein